MESGYRKMENSRNHQGGRRKGEGGKCASTFALPPSPLRLPPSAFTLTELLVVITIIAILASLITAGAMAALRRSKEAAITLEIGQLADAVERFKNETGGAYPPNTMNALNTSDENYAEVPLNPLVLNDFERSFRKAFPRHNEPAGLLQALSGGLSLPSMIIDSDVEGGMNAAEALYFWLGGFSTDPVHPISGPNGPSFADGPDAGSTLEASDEILENRARIYEFDLARLAPRDTEGVFTGRSITYRVDLNGNGSVDPGDERRINLWTYAPKNSLSSFAYFDASRHDPVDYDMDLSGTAGLKIFALKKLREGFSGTATPTPADVHFVNKNKFQILHAGIDDAWGDFNPDSITNATGTVATGNASAVRVFPIGPFTGDIADTLSNFAGGTLASEQE